MYTTSKQPLAKLRRYARELTERYHGAIQSRRYDDARAIRARQSRVQRAILIWQEWHPEEPPAELLAADSTINGAGERGFALTNDRSAHDRSKERGEPA